MTIQIPKFDNTLPFVLIGGVNVIESKKLVFETAETLKNICIDMNIPFVFKEIVLLRFCWSENRQNLIYPHDFSVI